MLESGTLSHTGKSNRIRSFERLPHALTEKRPLRQWKYESWCFMISHALFKTQEGYVDKNTSLLCRFVAKPRRRILSLEVSLRACPE